MYEDKTLKCKECGADFIFTAGEQEFYAEKGFQNEPQRCKACRDKRKNVNKEQREMFTTVCANCGKEARVDLDCFYEKRFYSYRWNRSHSDPRKDYPHTNTYDSTGKKVNLQMHALVMGTVDGKVIDHNDGDHYNASRSNLNHVTIAQNNQNRHSVVYNKRNINDQYASLYAQYVSLYA